MYLERKGKSLLGASDSCKQKITTLENIEIHVSNNDKVIGLLGSWMVSKKDFPNVGDVLSVKTPYRNWCIMLVFPTADAPRNTICSGLTFLDADIVVNKSSSVSIVFCRVTFPPQISAFLSIGLCNELVITKILSKCLWIKRDIHHIHCTCINM